MERLLDRQAAGQVEQPRDPAQMVWINLIIRSLEDVSTTASWNAVLLWAIAYAPPASTSRWASVAYPDHLRGEVAKRHADVVRCESDPRFGRYLAHPWLFAAYRCSAQSSEPLHAIRLNGAPIEF